MNIEEIYKKTDKVVSATPIVWCVIATVVSLYFMEPMEAVVVPLMGLAMFFLSSWAVRFLLLVQERNPFISSTNTLEYISAFFWASGLLGSLYFLFSGIYLYVTEPEYGAYMLMVWAFPLGISDGASKAILKNA